MNREKSKYLKYFIKLGQNIKAIRKTRKLSQEELAFMISGARNYIGCIERGEKSPSLTTIFKIKSALNCKLSDLFENIE